MGVDEETWEEAGKRGKEEVRKEEERWPLARPQHSPDPHRLE